MGELILGSPKSTRDRIDPLGLVVSSPYGALGASLLYLAAVHAFYELCRERSEDSRIYPDFFFFHVGRRHGYHGSLDVWPDHKEVLVEANGDRLLEAVNDRAIIRLIVPEGLEGGRPGQREGLAGYVANVIRAHLGEVSQETRDDLRRERQALFIDGRACETYRRIAPEDALEHFAARRPPGKRTGRLRFPPGDGQGERRPESDELAAMVATLDAIDYQTPFLVVDLDVMERNVARMSEYFAHRPAALRPHLKHHKCTEIARMQLDAGARGITCATSDELAAAVRASDAATSAGATVRVLVEYDVGMRRSGVDAITEALELAELVTRLPGLVFRGIQAYEGNLVGIPHRTERKARVIEAFAAMPHVLSELGDHGYEVEMFSGGSASTYDVSGNLPFMTDVQAGTYVLMDATYVQLVPEFEPALAAVSTVATARPGRPVVVDAGAKHMATDLGAAGLRRL